MSVSREEEPRQPGLFGASCMLFIICYILYITLYIYIYITNYIRVRPRWEDLASLP